MACTHLTQLYKLCQEQNLSFSSSDLVRIVCKECEAEEVCPSALVYQRTNDQTDEANTDDAPA